MSQNLTDQTIRIRKKITSQTQYFSKEINERGSLGSYSLVKKACKCCFCTGAVPVRNFLSYLKTLDKVVKIILITIIELCILLIQQDVNVFCSACSWPHINCTKPFTVMWRHGLWTPLWSTWLSVGFKKAREGQSMPEGLAARSRRVQAHAVWPSTAHHIITSALFNSSVLWNCFGLTWTVLRGVCTEALSLWWFADLELITCLQTWDPAYIALPRMSLKCFFAQWLNKTLQEK